MTTTRRPISFIATSDADAARNFYQNVIGLKLIEASPYALVFKDGDAMLRVQIVSDLTPAAFTVHGWEVGDIASEMAKLSKNGVTFEMFEGLPQDDQGVWTTPDGAKIVWFKDPSGNTLSLTQFP